jgi:hypothetical protein
VKIANIRHFALARVVLGVLTIAVLLRPASAQGPEDPVGVPDDWTHHHVVFSNPGTLADMLAPGVSPKKLSKWSKIYADPRFAIQEMKRGNALKDTQTTAPTSPAAAKPPKGKKQPPLVQGDWSMALGVASAGTVGAGNFPAKYRFETSGTPNCDSAATPDFAVFNTSLAGSATTAATGQVDFQGAPGTSATNAVVIGSISYRFPSTTTVSAPGAGLCNVVTGSSAVTARNNLFNAITNPTGGTSGTYLCTSATNTAVTNVVNDSGNSRITMSSSTPGTAGDFTLTENVNNVTVTKTSTGTDSQASILAYDNLYSGCTGTVPSMYWAYNTGGGRIANSVVLSLNGSKVAFVQTESGVAHLVVLKWSKNASATVGAATDLANDATCNGDAAPCMHSIALNGNPSSGSAPFYDYGTDTLWVGDSAGKLHKFKPVFLGEVAEITTPSPWPVTAGTGQLTDPVYDFGSGNIFVGVAATWKLARVNASSGAVTSSDVLRTAGGGDFVTPPMVDPSAGKVYAFINHGAASADTHRATVFQFPVGFTSGASPSEAAVGGNNSDTNPQYPGTFDNAYYTAANASSPSGNFYVCGLDGTASQIPALWRVPISSNTMGTPVEIGVIGTDTTPCSPVTEFFNGNVITTTLSAAVTNSTTTIPLTSGTNFNNNDFVVVDAEVMLITAGGGTTSLTVTRGRWGTTAAAHSSGARIDDVTSGAVATTTLSAAITTTGQTSVSVSSTTGFGVGDFIQIGTEIMKITAVGGATSLTVSRAQRSTTASTYSIGAAVKDVTLDRIFVGVATGAAGEPCTTGGCAFVFDVTTPPTSRVASAGLAATGGTSGIIIDNASTFTGASQLYYSTVGAGTCTGNGSTGSGTSKGCAVQASQSGLQ